MDKLVIANMVAMIGCVLMVAVGFLQKKRQILLVQCVQFGFLGASNILLGALTGAVSGAISILRNLVFLRKENTPAMKLGFVVVQVVLSLMVGIKGWIDWFPVLSTVLYTWFIDVKSEVRLKLVMIAAQVLWLVYDITYMNYVAAVFDGLTIGSNLVGILMLLHRKK